MCPYTLDHNKMLASTMQHSTHNHTPKPRTHHTHTPTTSEQHPAPQHRATRDALGNHAQERTRKNNPNHHNGGPSVSSGPNSVPNPPEHIQGKLFESAENVPPSHTTRTNPTKEGQRAVHGAESDERRTNPDTNTRSAHGRSPHHTVSSLERR